MVFLEYLMIISLFVTVRLNDIMQTNEFCIQLDLFSLFGEVKTFHEFGRKVTSTEIRISH